MRTKILTIFCCLSFIILSGIVTGVILNDDNSNESINIKNQGFHSYFKTDVAGDPPSWAIGEINGSWGNINHLKQKNELGTFTGYFTGKLIYSFLNCNIESGRIQGLFFKEDNENPSLVLLEEFLLFCKADGYHSFIFMKGIIDDNENDINIPFFLLGKTDDSIGSNNFIIYLQGQENMYMDGWYWKYG